ncbi:flagellar basal body-associated FliL family protein [Sphingomonas donggukensis]|uniref:Flagellar protein FliL n=1 Tax=Sphingomonas donggukensis TaxID=2949093 RepID=A0ABY4TT30_9SPHN|nr:flagellar basal body-associated FliL family protein [Sphingomonas donggukensis]URW75560.1 flagellar basal body-associated FliL family protein [Sphingomonas donggukensis]
MSDKTKTDTAETPKKKGKLVKLLMMGVGLIALVGGGVGAGLYAASSGLIGGGHAAEGAAEADTPRLVPKAEEKRASAAGSEGGEGGGEGAAAEGEGEGAAKAESHAGLPTPKGAGGDKYASTYYTIEKEFTSNLKESVHFIQVGLAVSTPYDDRVIDNLKTHEIAVRSAVLMTLGDTDEDTVFTNDGKQQLQRRLAQSINGVLKQKEGFGGVGNVYFTNFVVQ